MAKSESLFTIFSPRRRENKKIFWYLYYRMQKINTFEYHSSSVSLRKSTHRRAKAGLWILRRNGIHYSESELFQRLMKLYLQKWQGNGGKSASARRYNVKGPGYVIRPWYVSKVLYSLVWQRAIHSGESVSRMLDFAVRYYLPQLLESLLRTPMPCCPRSNRNAPYWEKKYRERKHKAILGFINYSCETSENQNGRIRYVQESTFFPKNHLDSAQILNLTYHAI